MSNVYINDLFRKHINLPVETVFEIGSNNSEYTEHIIQAYNPKRYFSVECNPKLTQLCQNTIDHMVRKYGIDGVFIDKALSDKDGSLEYWTVKSDDPGWLGSSSVYKHHYLPMEKLNIECTTLDSICDKNSVRSIDLICCDIEGGELAAFTNQKILNSTKYMIVEVGVDRNWKPGYPVLADLMDVISPLGFEVVEFLWANGGKEFGDGLFINKNLEM